MKLFTTLFAAIALFAFAGCGGEEPATETETTENSIPEEHQEETPAATGGIVLADGWTMSDAVSPEEVEAIMCESGFGVFAEAASSASSGRPIGSYNISDVPYSKVRFEANVNGGQEAFDSAAGYLENTSEMDSQNWDSALIGDVQAGDRTQKRVLVLKGDLFISVSWEPAVYPELDEVETSILLAELLIGNLYGE